MGRIRSDIPSLCCNIALNFMVYANDGCRYIIGLSAWLDERPALADRLTDESDAGTRIFMKVFTKVTSYGLVTLLASLFLLMAYASISHDPHWHIEELAVPTPDHPLAGLWKEESCEPPWGLAIGPISSGLYYVSFCGPGGCLDRGEYRPNTPILDDPHYKVINQNTLLFLQNDNWSTMVRCKDMN